MRSCGHRICGLEIGERGISAAGRRHATAHADATTAMVAGLARGVLEWRRDDCREHD